MKTLTDTEFQELNKRLANIEALLLEKQKHPTEIIYDNSDFIRLMNISKRTAQDWRDEGLITFSQIGNKIYYRQEYVKEFMDKHLKPSSKKK
jgi:hypothetical protein